MPPKFAGSSQAELLEASRKIVGQQPLEVAAQHHPLHAWRVWTSTYPRDYNEESEVRNASIAELRCVGLWC